MPGVNIVFDAGGDLKQKESQILDSLGSLVHNQQYKSETPFSGDHVFLGCTKHEKYQVSTFDSDELLICIDGFIFGKPQPEVIEELRGISESIFNDEKNYKNRIAEWLLDTDGDFVITVLNKNSREICIVNDALGRLPLYYSKNGRLLLVSREIRFIVNLAGSVGFDREAVSQYLLFGYPLGRKTLIENIFQLEPGSMIRAGVNRPEIEVESIHRFNFEEKEHGTRELKKHAHHLVELLHEACKNRVDTADTNVVALSGGLDSRAVSICLKNLEAPFAAATFLDYYGAVGPDIEYSRQIADKLKIERNLFRLERAKGKDVLELLKVKNGLNYLGVSFSIPLINRIKETYGDRITLFTGDGGDRVLRDTMPVGRVNDIDALAKYIISYNQMMPPDIVSALTNTDKDELTAGLKERLMRYDEKDMKMKYLHYVFYERIPKWHFQGEDRNRCFVRPVTPFYSIKVFNYSMNCLDSLKVDFKLYREILVELSPAVAAINNSEWNLPITSKKLGLYLLGRNIYFALPKKLRRIVQLRHWYSKKIGAYAQDSNVMKCLLEQLDTCRPISDYLSVDEVRKNAGSIDKMGFDHLFTLTSMMEYFLGSGSTIEKYYESDLL